METRKLGRTGLDVSLICLGTMTWGQQNTEAEAHAQMDYALEHGVNFFDTAEMYPVPNGAQTVGRTEAYIGSWMASRKSRDKIILATKVAGPSNMSMARDGSSGLDAANIRLAIDASLQRLGTDVIDLYQVHWPARRTNYFGRLGYVHDDDHVSVEIGETFEALADLIRGGKVRHIGLSNETPWGVMQFLKVADAAGLGRPVSIQNPYSLLNRSFEVGLAEMAIREDVGLLAYSPLSFGALSGKYLNNQAPPDGRLTLFPEFSRYLSPPGVAATKAYVDIANQAGLDPAQMALGYVNTRRFVTSTIIGATTMDQLAANIASTEITLSSDVVNAIEAVHEIHTYPSP
ncbi:MAG: NADP(H)-dependent aldo-keto reductase [Alphaproteobacteria bacterium]|nr:NADP(H)-dependent aldo-keto reductase [Alphaproteobacteria bacterium]MBT5860532.1 NADP(H)-dependent aldo-keto reductase [Alphaproteobacteria bacterium]